MLFDVNFFQALDSFHPTATSISSLMPSPSIYPSISTFCIGNRITFMAMSQCSHCTNQYTSPGTQFTTTWYYLAASLISRRPQYYIPPFRTLAMGNPIPSNLKELCYLNFSSPPNLNRVTKLMPQLFLPVWRNNHRRSDPP